MKKHSFILLRGLARESRHWGPFVDELRAQDFCREVHLLDSAGSGRFQQDSVPWTIVGFVEHLRRQVADAGPEPFWIIGMSMGGMLALEWLSRYPQQIAGVVVMNTSAGGVSPFYQRMRVSAYLTLLSILQKPRVDEREKMVLQLVSNLYGNDRQILDEWVRIQVENPISLGVFAKQILACARFQLPTGIDGKRVLVLSSKKDRLVNSSSSQRIAEALGSRLVVHPAAGHDLAIDDADWVFAQIRDFLV